MTERDERLYFAEILEAIDRIITHTSGGREAFFDDAKTQDAAIRNIEIIGEAVRGVSQSTRLDHPEIPWTKIAGTRDRVIHAATSRWTSGSSGRSWRKSWLAFASTSRRFFRRADREWHGPPGLISGT
jgi:uncharacterized protein with HEPN domain